MESVVRFNSTFNSSLVCPSGCCTSAIKLAIASSDCSPKSALTRPSNCFDSFSPSCFLLNSLESSCFLFDNGLSIPCLPTSMLLSIAQMCYRYHCVCQKGTILPDSIGLVQAQNCQVDLAHSDCIPVELNRSKNPTHTLLLLAKPCIK